MYTGIMKKYIERQLTEIIINRLQYFPVVAVLGPRQCGKSTLVKKILKNNSSSLYLDLELQSDYNKLSDPEAFFILNGTSLICLDEVQRTPDIFSVIRGIVDKTNIKGQFLVLGSASPLLLRQSSETLAGRIALLDLTPFTISELDPSNIIRHWQRGGFPDSFLADSDEVSIIWRENFIRTYLERDIPSLGFHITTNVIQRLWTMLAHMSGQIFNSSGLASSLGVSSTTVRTYIEILEQTYMVRILHPYFVNIKKRLIKSPKVYIRDTGILHSLLGIENHNSLMGNPVYGNSWESYALEQICSQFTRWSRFYYRTSAGAEIDLILEKGNNRIAVEFKVSTAPKVTTGFYNALGDLNIEKAFIIAPLLKDEFYPLNDKCNVCTLSWFLTQETERVVSSLKPSNHLNQHL